ncbi:hypothetical protein UA08_03026 [Talaromyces atroroseus]|uniref:Uncharacterized protein n=1 Tax=Talaromyces atroroseus TaxID=1441469 RepID=A0A225AWW5_TALAT|nr:hypothetical protein UA08_03026 [Talaromyces atroroseus]OKL61818.1 hypothetical protein UA08_03026 [Talaromyces atroroseus]
MDHNEKSASADVEMAKPNDGDIITPLLLLLAARRGFQHDSGVAQLAVPEDYVLSYRGQSGVKAINHTSWLVRLICALGYKSVGSCLAMVFLIFSLSQSTMSLISDDTSPSSKLRVGALVATAAVLLIVIARIYAKRHTAAATPPWCDPESYQCRLTAAMAKANIQYRDIVSATLAEMEKLWKEEEALCERLTIQGLIDPEDRQLVYDVVLKFYNNGGVVIQFPFVDTAPKTRPGILISKAAEKRSIDLGLC